MISTVEEDIRKLTRAERDRLAAQALAARQARRDQNRRARQRSKERGQVRMERLVPRELVEELRELITHYVAARKQGLTVEMKILPTSGKMMDEALITGPGRAASVPRNTAAPEAGNPASSDLKDRFHDTDYRPALAARIHAIAVDKGPLPRNVLELMLAKQHGFASTGKRIREVIADCLGEVEIHDEFGRPFAWAAGSHAARIPWRGRRDRLVTDISRHEWASLLDQHADALRMATSPAREIAAIAGLRNRTAAINQHLEELHAWWQVSVAREEDSDSPGQARIIPASSASA